MKCRRFKITCIGDVLQVPKERERQRRVDSVQYQLKCCGNFHSSVSLPQHYNTLAYIHNIHSNTAVLKVKGLSVQRSHELIDVKWSTQVKKKKKVQRYSLEKSSAKLVLKIPSQNMTADIRRGQADVCGWTDRRTDGRRRTLCLPLRLDQKALVCQVHQHFTPLILPQW